MVYFTKKKCVCIVLSFTHKMYTLSGTPGGYTDDNFRVKKKLSFPISGLLQLYADQRLVPAVYVSGLSRVIQDSPLYPRHQPGAPPPPDPEETD